MSGLTTEPQVLIVDDDAAVRDSVSLWLECNGYNTRCFVDGEAFLEAYSHELRGCIIADIRMPGMNGLELQTHLNERNNLLPLIFITGHGTVPMAVEAMRHGALDYLRKPVDEQQLLKLVEQAFEADAANATQANLFSSLTKRECQVGHLVVDGKANKVIAGDLNISERTVEVHRANVMRKLKAKTLAQLVKLWSPSSLVS